MAAAGLVVNFGIRVVAPMDVPETIENSRIVLTAITWPPAFVRLTTPNVVGRRGSIKNRRLAGQDAIGDAPQEQVASLRADEARGQGIL